MIASKHVDFGSVGKKKTATQKSQVYFFSCMSLVPLLTHCLWSEKMP